jgi:hypothetical protein
MPAPQIFGYTPTNPDTGMVGYVAIHAPEADADGATITVRAHGCPDGMMATCPLPASALQQLGDAALAASFHPTTKDEAAEPMLQFFAFAHLPAHLQAISMPFGLLATRIVDTLPRNPERSAALRKPLEAKDCAVRALLYRP